MSSVKEALDNKSVRSLVESRLEALRTIRLTSGPELRSKHKAYTDAKAIYDSMENEIQELEEFLENNDE